MARLILIIDDDREFRQSLKLGLEQNGFAVVTAESAVDAGEVMKRVAPDAVVLDRMMEGLDGLSYLRELRAAGDETPVIMLTAMGGGDNTIDGLSGGADDYMAKPFKLRELALRLGNMLKKSAAAAPARKMPENLAFASGEFFADKKLIPMSAAEKAALRALIDGETVPMQPMAARRLKGKLRLANLKNIDIINVRNKGYKLVMSY
jgi:two-component system phosphate regulon response regulator OmpR